MTANIQTGAYSFDDATTLTVASGVLTVTQAVHIVACESGTTDDIDTINVPSAMATPVTLYLRSDSGDTNTLKHGTGNIILPGGTDVDIDDDTIVQLLHNGTSVYLVGASSAGGSGAPTDATYITQTANGTLTNEQALSTLQTGAMIVTTTTGVITSLKHNISATASPTQSDDNTQNYSVGSMWIDVTNDRIFRAVDVTTANAIWQVQGVGSLQPQPPTGRLSLSSTLPIPVSSLTAVTSIYYHPWEGGVIWLYDGTSQWLPYTFGTAITASLAGLTANLPYDVFVYNNAGTLTLDLTAWSTATARATALTTVSGLDCKTGATTRLYVGTIRINSTGGQSDWSPYATQSAFLGVWNRFNRIKVSVGIQEPTASWTYATQDVWRSARASDANRVTYVQGLDIEPIMARPSTYAFSATGQSFAVGVGIDSTSANSAQNYGAFATSVGVRLFAEYAGRPGIGGHFAQWLEVIDTTNTVTYKGTGGGNYDNSGMIFEGFF